MFILYILPLSGLRRWEMLVRALVFFGWSVNKMTELIINKLFCIYTVEMFSFSLSSNWWT